MDVKGPSKEMTFELRPEFWWGEASEDYPWQEANEIVSLRWTWSRRPQRAFLIQRLSGKKQMNSMWERTQPSTSMYKALSNMLVYFPDLKMIKQL